METKEIEVGKEPFLAMAVLCERVLEEKDGVLSLIRIVDRLVHAAGPEGPEEMPAILAKLVMVLGFKSGAVHGKRTVTVRLVDPANEVKGEWTFPVLFEGEDKGANLIINMSLKLEKEGLHWFDVLLEKKLVTRVPLRVVYMRVVSESSQKTTTQSTQA